MIRTVISDLGRVVLWFDNSIFLRKLAERAGLPYEDVRQTAHIDLELVRAFDAGTLTPGQVHDRVTRALGLEMSYQQYFEIYNDIFSPNPPVIGLLRRVKAAGYRLALLSNTDPERFGFIRGRFPEILFFDDYVLSYELKLIKPNPAIYMEAVRRAGSRPDECVFIDDMEENVRAAVSVGLAGIHYQPETDLAAGLKKLGLVF